MVSVFHLCLSFAYYKIIKPGVSCMIQCILPINKTSTTETDFEVTGSENAVILLARVEVSHN